MREVIRRLASSTERKRAQFREDYAAFAARHGLSDWEGWFHPYPDETYREVLRNINADDIVLDIGAGDLRLALHLAARARRVYAVEINPLLVAAALEEIGLDLPRKLHVICANALDMTVPPNVTVAVLLMRHCPHFADYFDRLQAAGCQWLITNARWKSHVEAIDLTAGRIPYDQVQEGWYACRCGAVGYVGRGERSEAPAGEVLSCPSCRA
jgi:SAM-dependent methyltransferase